MTWLDDLIAAGRNVEAGLEAYDGAVARLGGRNREELAADGVDPEEIEAFLGENEARIRDGRNRLTAQLWLRNIAAALTAAADRIAAE